MAVDCELSGLGERRKLNAPQVDERYRNTCLVAKTRSIISLGLSLFRFIPRVESEPSWTYSCTTYNLLVLCSEDYIVEPASLQFLVQHGFDFGAQYSLGIGYNRGNDLDESQSQLREIFSEIVLANRPLVLHNGLIDLIFLYHNLWAALPPKLETFIADLSQMFPAGLYDTKFLADFVARTQASYLEFVFRREFKVNTEKFHQEKPHVRMIFPAETDNEDTEVRYVGCEDTEGEGEVCPSYSNHGHCGAGQDCPLSHNIHLIVRQKTQDQHNRWRKRKIREEDQHQPTKHPKLNGSSAAGPARETTDSGCHRAGYDAFMTGFSMATFLVHHTKIPHNPVSWHSQGINTQKIVNRIYLACKDFPLLVQKSTFAKCSEQHHLKLSRLDPSK